MDIRTAIRHVTSRQDLTTDQMVAVMREIMSGQSTDAQNAAFLVGLQMKGISVAELTGGAQVMRELVQRVAVSPDPHLVDTCGTGGSGSNKFNVSTAAALVASCAGAKVAKHGNRGASSKSGSADVLEAAGVRLDLTPAQVAQTIDTLRVGFMFAPNHHAAMRHVITARREIGIRTLFNLLGPLTNPAGAPNQVMGVFDAAWIDPLLSVFRALGSHHVLVLHADDGLDEISVAAATQVGELRDGQSRRYTVQPEDFGVARRPDYRELQVEGPQQSLALLRSALGGAPGAAADIIALNAGAAIYAADLVDDLAAGVAKAQQVLASGAALEKLETLAAYTRDLAA